MENPLFSVITPTHNRPHLLKRCMKSVSSQTINCYEHIIVDDGSYTDTGNIVEELQNNHTVYLRHGNSKGVAAAYNAGIKYSKGELVVFLDDDDEAMPSLLEKLKAAFSMNSKDIGFILTGIEKVTDKGSREVKESVVTWPDQFSNREEALIAATSVGNVGVCIKKECFNRVGLYDEEICFAEDTDLIFRILQSYNFCAVPDVLVKKHKHSSFQLTGDENYIDRIRGIEIILKRYKEMIEALPKLHSVHYSSYAYLCYESSLRMKGRKAMLDVIKRNPGRVKSYLDMVSLEMFGVHAGGTLIGQLFKKMKVLSN